MSSLANAIKRKTHKERSQPAARRKYGLLEKKKDYLLRAKDYHKKDKTIKHLQSKAEQRNPDEFYFAMEKSQTKDGVHIQRSTEANKYTQQELLLMKTQDAKYLGLKSRTEAAKAEKLKESLHFIGLAPQNKHTVFVESAAEGAAFQASQFFDTPAELLGRTYNRPRNAQLQQQQAAPSTATAERVERRKASAYRELSQRLDRQQKLAGLASKMAFDKEVMGKGRKRKLADAAGSSSQPAYRWKQERKK